MKHIKNATKNILVLLFWLAVWQALAAIVAKPLLLPSPPEVLSRLSVLVTDGVFWKITAASLFRILLGMAAAVVTGTLLAVLTSVSKILHALISPLLVVIKSTPVASFILLALIWMGRDILPAFTAFLMVVPVIWANVSAGISGTDFRLLELSRVYGFSPLKTLRRIYIPSVMPHFLSAVRSAIGLAWKAGIAAEVLTVPKSSIGKLLYEAKLNLETTDLFAWTLVVVLCSLVIEKAVMSAVSSVGRAYERKGGDL